MEPLQNPGRFNYAASVNYSCNAGDGLSGSTCTNTNAYSATVTYSCPSGGSLNGGSCSRNDNYAASIFYTCNAGDALSGNSCTHTGTYNAAVNYSCPSGGSLSGSNCSRNDNYAASVNYSCNPGDGLNGSTCTHTNYVQAQVNYSCPSGSTLRLTTCESPAYAPATTSYNCNGLISNGSGLCTGAGVSANDQYAAWDACMAQGDSYGLSLNGVTLARSRYYNCVFQANTAYSCPNGGALSGNQCVSTSSQPATPSYSCSAGTLSGTQCVVPQSYAATPNYSCPNGGTVSGSTCLKTTDYAGTAAYSCPGGGTLNGGTCTQTSSYTATTNYSCPSGDPLSGSTCLKTTVYTATPSYSCPSGGSLNGTSCTVTSAYAATPDYSCTGADTLNGSTCTRTTTIAATPNYSCPNGATPSNGQCTGTNSTSTAYIYLGGKQIAETVIGGDTQYVHTDALGSPVAHTSQAGAETSRTKFEPYGYTAGGTKPGPAMAGMPTTGSAIGFTGHVNDPETDLVYMQQRYYDPIAGRFLSIDPVVTDANTGNSFNRYGYAKSNPYSYIDPDGRAVESITVDKNWNVHIVLGMSYRGNVTISQAAAFNASIINKFSGKFGKYNLTMTIIPSSQAKFGNIVTVVEKAGIAQTNGNNGREVTLYRTDLRGNTIEECLHHEILHVIGANKVPLDKYLSWGEALPGWEGNLAADASGNLEERNVDEMMGERPYLPREIKFRDEKKK